MISCRKTRHWIDPAWIEADPALDEYVTERRESLDIDELLTGVASEYRSAVAPPGFENDVLSAWQIEREWSSVGRYILSILRRTVGREVLYAWRDTQVALAEACIATRMAFGLAYRIVRESFGTI